MREILRQGSRADASSLYVRRSGKGLSVSSYGFYLALLFVGVVLLRVDFYFTVLYFLGAIWVLARAWTRRTVDHLRVSRTFVDRAFLGDEVRVDLAVENTGWLPAPWLEVAESVPVQLRTNSPGTQVVSLGSHETWRSSYTLSCQRRGLYPVGPLSMHTGDLLGIQPRVTARSPAGRLTVYPKVVPLEHLGLPTRSPLVSLPARSPLFEDASRIMGVRDYQRGDSQRRVHWSASARAQKLVVKQYQPAIARETMICLDMDIGSYDPHRRYEATELAVVVAASVASHVVREGQPVGLVSEAHDPLIDGRARFSVPPRSDRAHLLMSVLEALARVQPLAEGGFGEMVRAESVRFSWGATVVLVTGQESAGLYDTLLGLRRGGFAVSLILVHPRLASRELQAGAGTLGVAVHRVWTEHELEALR